MTSIIKASLVLLLLAVAFFFETSFEDNQAQTKGIDSVLIDNPDR